MLAAVMKDCVGIVEGIESGLSTLRICFLIWFLTRVRSSSCARYCGPCDSGQEQSACRFFHQSSMVCGPRWAAPSEWGTWWRLIWWRLICVMTISSPFQVGSPSCKCKTKRPWSRPMFCDGLGITHMMKKLRYAWHMGGSLYCTCYMKRKLSTTIVDGQSEMKLTWLRDVGLLAHIGIDKDTRCYGRRVWEDLVD